MSRLDDIRLELEEGDLSLASLLQKVDDEPELRNLIANWLRRDAAGRYTVAPEEENADGKRTDIQLHHPGIATRVPIELKIAEQWSSSQLRERLENQLVRQYMQEGHSGIFLVCLRKKYDRTWTVEGLKGVRFGRLIEWLQGEAQILRSAYPSIDEVSVIGIDFTLRHRSGELTSSQVRAHSRDG